jgi:glucose/mannose transport system substrate-binding protein
VIQKGSIVKGLVRTSLHLVAAALVGSLAGCGSSSSASPEDSHIVEIFSWWTAGGEKDALDAMVAYHLKAHPDQKIINAAQQGGDNAQQLLATRIADGVYPETFQLNAGWALRDWAARTAGDGNKLLAPLDSMPEAAEWKSAFSPAVLDAVSYKGQMYAVPVNVHRTNSLFFNKKVFDDRGLTPPTTLAELFQVCDALAASTPKVIPLAISSKEAWTVNLFIFENLLVAEAGPQYYQDFFTGKKSPDDPEIAKTLTDALALWKYTDPSGKVLRWDQAVEQVEIGDAAMTVMGDWAKGHFESNGKKPDVDFGALPMPGSQEGFVYGPDCFTLMAGAHNPKGAMDLLATFGSRGGQDVFNPIKGSIPARKEPDKTLFDSISQRTIDDFSSKQQVLGLSGLIPAEVGSALTTAVGTFIETKDPSGVIQALKDNYSKLTP